MTDMDERFEFWFRVYMNDLRLKGKDDIDQIVLAWEIDLARTHLEEMIPQSHLDAVAAL